MRRPAGAVDGDWPWRGPFGETRQVWAALEEPGQHLAVAAECEPVDRPARLREAGAGHVARLVEELSDPLFAVAFEPVRRLPAGAVASLDVSRSGLGDHELLVARHPDRVVAEAKEDYADRDRLSEVRPEGREIIIFGCDGDRERRGLRRFHAAAHHRSVRSKRVRPAIRGRRAAASPTRRLSMPGGVVFRNTGPPDSSSSSKRLITRALLRTRGSGLGRSALTMADRRSGRPAFASCEHRRVIERAADARFAAELEMAVNYPFTRLQDFRPPLDLIHSVFHRQDVAERGRCMRARGQRHRPGRAMQRDRTGVARLKFAAYPERLGRPAAVQDVRHDYVQRTGLDQRRE